MSKAQDNWANYTSGIPGLDASIEAKGKQVINDDSNDFRSFLDALPGEVSDEIGEPLKTEDIDLTKAIDHHWCLCEMPEGDFPRVYAFQSIRRLVEAIAKREGQETAVWAMYGIPLRLTRLITAANGKQVRYLLLPNQLAVAISEASSLTVIEQSLLPDDLATQDEGWLGDPDYLKEQQYFLDANVDNNAFSSDPDMDSDDESPEFE